jgi:ATP-dependent DNA helicase RecG
MNCLPINIEDLIHTRTVESNRVEFKATWDDQIKPAVVKSVCAFANDLFNLNGGYIVLGIETDELGNPILPPRGMDSFDLDLIQREIRGQCRRIEPEFQPLICPDTLQGKAIVVLWAPGGDNRPYQAPGRGGDRAYFVRQGAETVEARGDILRQLLERAAKVPFDDRRALNAKVEDISPSLVRHFLHNVRSRILDEMGSDDRALYRRMRIVAPINNHEVPRNVGLLFFHPSPEQFFPGTRIDLVQFSDDAGGNLIEERSIKGPLDVQVRFSLDYLNSIGDVLLEKVSGRAAVDRTVAYPYGALEEAVVNAVYHRSYEGPPEPIKIYLYPDRMEIISYPGPVPGIELDHLMRPSPIPPVPARNRRVGELLKELRLAEQRGTGVPKIRRTMEENGSPAPVFDFDEGRTYFRVTLPVHPRYRVLHALREGARLWAIGERRSALSHLQRAFEQRPGSGALAGQIVEYAAALGDVDLAARTLERFRSESQQSEAALPFLSLARAFLDTNKVEDARRIMSQLPPQSSAADLVEAAIIAKRARDYEEAHRLFSRAYPMMKDDAKTIQEFAQTKLALARRIDTRKDIHTKRTLNREAVELLRRAIQITDDSVREAWCWHDLAQTLDWLKEPSAEVEAAYLKALVGIPEQVQFKRDYDKWKARRQRSR